MFLVIGHTHSSNAVPKSPWEEGSLQQGPTHTQPVAQIHTATVSELLLLVLDTFLMLHLTLPQVFHSLSFYFRAVLNLLATIFQINYALSPHFPCSLSRETFIQHSFLIIYIVLAQALEGQGFYLLHLH